MRHADDAVAIDARNRAWHAFVSGLVLDVVVAAAMFAAQGVGAVSDRASAGVFAFSVLKTVLHAAAVYIARNLQTPAAGTSLGGGDMPAAAGAAVDVGSGTASVGGSALPPQRNASGAGELGAGTSPIL